MINNDANAKFTQEAPLPDANAFNEPDAVPANTTGVERPKLKKNNIDIPKNGFPDALIIAKSDASTGDEHGDATNADVAPNKNELYGVVLSDSLLLLLLLLLFLFKNVSIDGNCTSINSNK